MKMFAGALALNHLLNSSPEKLSDPASPDTVTEVVMPDPKSAPIETLPTELKYLLFRFFNSDFTLSASHVSGIPASV